MCLLEILQQLLQRLSICVNYSMVVEEYDYGPRFHIHEFDCRCSISCTLPSMWLCSLMLVELQSDLTLPQSQVAIADSLPSTATEMELTYARAIDDIWRNYHQQCDVKSLLRLCILFARKSMRSLDDDSFLSLPVPPYLRKLLTYRDVSEKIFEQWCEGPPVSTQTEIVQDFTEMHL